MFIKYAKWLYTVVHWPKYSIILFWTRTTTTDSNWSVVKTIIQITHVQFLFFFPFVDILLIRLIIRATSNFW